MALAQPLPVQYGSPVPRLAPPTPAKSDVKGFKATSAELGITLMPWQETAARYLEAKGPDGNHLYREVAIVVARQNGKTTLVKPLIIRALRDGKRVMHIAQTRELPRAMFGIIAASLDESLFLQRRGKGGKMQTIWPRHGAGQEEILLKNGGSYRIAAVGRGGARGWTNDLVIIDELREMDSWEVIHSVEPTLVMSEDPQLVYLSNAGDEDSVVLNAVRERAGEDATLAYLEWSAAPERTPDDPVGWAEANPALGHFPSVMRTLDDGYRKHKLGGTLPIFETEHLCRSVASMRELLVGLAAWNRCEVTEPGTATRPVMAVSMDPNGRRASAALAWQEPEGFVGLRLLYDVPGHPIDADALGRDLKADAKRLAVTATGFDPLSDAQLARHFLRKQPVTGREFANASARFVALVEAGKIRWRDAAAVGSDLSWTTRKAHDDTGAFQAVRASDERPIPAALAAIRAVWLASEPPKSSGSRRPGTVGF